MLETKDTEHQVMVRADSFIHGNITYRVSLVSKYQAQKVFVINCWFKYNFGQENLIHLVKDQFKCCSIWSPDAGPWLQSICGPVHIGQVKDNNQNYVSSFVLLKKLPDHKDVFFKVLLMCLRGPVETYCGDVMGSIV